MTKNLKAFEFSFITGLFRCFLVCMPVIGFAFSGSPAPAEDTVQYRASVQIYTAKDAVISNSRFIHTSENKTSGILHIGKDVVVFGLETLHNAKIVYVPSVSTAEKKPHPKLSETYGSNKHAVEKAPENKKTESVTVLKDRPMPGTSFNAVGGSSYSGISTHYFNLFFAGSQKLKLKNSFYYQPLKLLIKDAGHIISVHPITTGIRPPPFVLFPEKNSVLVNTIGLY